MSRMLSSRVERKRSRPEEGAGSEPFAGPAPELKGGREVTPCSALLAWHEPPPPHNGTSRPTQQAATIPDNLTSVTVHQRVYP